MDLADLKITWGALKAFYKGKISRNKNLIDRHGIHDNDEKRRFVALYDKSTHKFVDYYIVYKRNDGLWYMDHPIVCD